MSSSVRLNHNKRAALPSAVLDTNILLDMAISERPGWSYACLLLDAIATGKLEGFVSSLSLKDLYYILTKYRSEAHARSYLQAALELFEIIGVDVRICKTAAWSNEADFEDGIIRACAENTNVDVIISRDTSAYKNSHIRRLSAQEYVELFM